MTTPATDTTSPAVDAAGAPGDVVDSTPTETAPADSGEQPTDDLTTARAERDAAKVKRRDAEARADALALRVAELERDGAELSRLRTENTQLRDAATAVRREQVERELWRVLAPSFKDSARMLLDTMIGEGVQLDDPGADAKVIAKLRARSPELFSHRHESPPGPPPRSIRSPI